MGCFSVTVKIAGQVSKPFLVDTGATYSVAPADLLRDIGIEPMETVRTRLANGMIEPIERGEVMLEIPGLTRAYHCPILFGGMEAPFLLGATALEIFSLCVDPVEKRLVHMQHVDLLLKECAKWHG